jgi:UPF0271 protein
MRRVLDTSAFLSGRQFPGELLTTPDVLRELERHGLTPALEAFLGTKVSVLSPGPESLARVRTASAGTGDAPRLSPTDVRLVALALEADGTLVTDDYSIQNVGTALGIPFEAVSAPGITAQWRWTYRCSGCGAAWPTFHRECPTCGSALRTQRARDGTLAPR